MLTQYFSPRACRIKQILLPHEKKNKPVTKLTLIMFLITVLLPTHTSVELPTTGWVAVAITAFPYLHPSPPLPPVFPVFCTLCLRESPPRPPTHSSQ